MQITAVAASAVDTAPVVAHTVVLVGKDTDAVVHLPDMFLAQVVDSLPGKTDRVVVVVDRAAVVADNIVAVVVVPCQRRPWIPG